VEEITFQKLFVEVGYPDHRGIINGAEKSGMEERFCGEKNKQSQNSQCNDLMGTYFFSQFFEKFIFEKNIHVVIRTNG
jgi:hypothetical protein